MIRVGSGFDIHKLVEFRKFVIGGVVIPYEKGILAHSDGDVLIHSLIDALLGSVGERDIGYYFPNTTSTKDIDSKVMLREVIDLIDSKGFEVVNIDVTVVVNKPKLQPYIPQVKKSLSEIVKIPENRIAVKAKTTEGFFYQDDGIMVFSSVLVKKSFLKTLIKRILSLFISFRK